jgi:L-2-hydroxyglutarate oxidase LhgO
MIDQIKNQAEKNGVEGIKKISKTEASNLEPLIYCEEALLVSSSGIVDVVSLMRSLVGRIQDSGSMIAYKSEIKKINFDGNKFLLSVMNDSETTIECKKLVNSAGLFASNVANTIEELKKEFIPKTYYAKGNYFSVSKNLGIRHLIYPIPEGFVLGIHLTLELDHSIKFGPDVEWVDKPDDYKVDINKKKLFINEIMKFLPDLDSDSLNPSYAGIRPIVEKKEKSKRDFIIQTASTHSIPNLINLYGIESPGLTSSLAIALHVRDLLE